jgi:tetratricopeptide (TPR) repeat protein
MIFRRSVRTVLCVVGIVLYVPLYFLGNTTAVDKPESWVEATTPHFTVLCNDGEKTARRIARQFEQIRILYSRALSPNLRVDPEIPILIIAAKNEKSLSQVLPENWAQKGHVHPAGIFLPGAERNYIAVRTDVQEEFPYLIVYHECVHLIVNLNYQHFPLWLNEGYATFLGSATLSATSGSLGQPNETEIGILKRTNLLPLDVLFRVEHGSPYYNEEEKTNVFYAESWALVHYLMSSPSRQKGRQLLDYIARVENGDDPVDAARAAFGDLYQLKQELDSYVSRTVYSIMTVDLPDAADPRSYIVRNVSRAEADAMLGEFDVSRRQFASAKPKIEEALRLNPNLAVAQESMGFLLFREGRRAEAQKYFSRAVALDSKNAMTYYYDGMLLVSDVAEEEDADEAEASLEKAVALKPGLASAWDALSSLYVSDPKSLQKALNASERAVKGVPGEPRYRFNLAIVLLRMGRFEEARTIAQGLGGVADRDLSARVIQFLKQIDRKEQAAASSDKSRRDLEARADPPESAPTHAPSPPGYSMTGTIEELSCADAPQAQMTLQASGIVLHLHAADFDKIEFKMGDRNDAAAKPTCIQFAKKQARVSYDLVSGKPWDGEIISVDLQSVH